MIAEITGLLYSLPPQARDVALQMVTEIMRTPSVIENLQRAAQTLDDSEPGSSPE